MNYLSYFKHGGYQILQAIFLLTILPEKIKSAEIIFKRVVSRIFIFVQKEVSARCTTSIFFRLKIKICSLLGNVGILARFPFFVWTFFFFYFAWHYLMNNNFHHLNACLQFYEFHVYSLQNTLFKDILLTFVLPVTLSLGIWNINKQLHK